MCFLLIINAVKWYVRLIVKWFLRKTTKSCELQRLCYTQSLGAPRTLRIELSLRNSTTPKICGLLTVLDAQASQRKFCSERAILLTNAISMIKTVKRIDNCEFVLNSLKHCIDQIWSYMELVEENKYKSEIQYDCTNDAHEKLLIRLWEELKPNDRLESRVTKQWQDIGFQGDDPKTDFRGMGLLGLENLVYFASKYTRLAQNILLHSMHQILGYNFAIAGINLTSLACELVVDGSAKIYFYNIQNAPKRDDFHEFYCYLFWEYDKFMLEKKPKDLMDFALHQKEFTQNIRQKLGKTDAGFIIDISNENLTGM